MQAFTALFIFLFQLAELNSSVRVEVTSVASPVHWTDTTIKREYLIGEEVRTFQLLPSSTNVIAIVFPKEPTGTIRI